MTGREPHVSIVLLSWNRKEDLRVSLQALDEIPQTEFEVIVVDNASTDGTVEMLRQEFPRADVIALEKNIGIAGWNCGFARARGRYVLVLDDDSYPVGEGLSTAAQVLDEDAGCGVVAFEVHNAREGRSQTAHLREIVATTFVGCGALIRKSVIENVGGFEPLLFLYGHEEEFAMRVIDAGFTVRYESKAVVIHTASVVHRTIDAKNEIDRRRLFFNLRSNCIILALHFSAWRAVRRIVTIVLGRMLFGIFHRCFFATLRATASFVGLLPALFRSRSVLSDRTQAMYGYGAFAGGFWYREGERSVKRTMKRFFRFGG